MKPGSVKQTSPIGILKGIGGIKKLKYNFDYCKLINIFMKETKKQDPIVILKTLPLIFALFLFGCATKGPVLYPNAHMKSVGEEKALSDINECKSNADVYVKSSAGINAVKSTAVGGAAGAIIGGAAGAVTGDIAGSAGVGAATGAASGLLLGIFKGSEPNPVYKSFIEKCLREKGYEVIGWE
jgi:outer membrane lipoprotein SlyB